MEIIPNVHLIPGIVGTPYLIVDEDGLTLIDAGLGRSGKKILNYITRLGYSAQDLRRIVITHADGDHVGGLAVLKAASGARAYANPIEAEAIAEGRRSRELRAGGPRKWLLALMAPLFKVTPAEIDERVTDGQILPALGGLHVVETPGHSPGHISLFAPSVGILFVGDSMISGARGLSVSRGANTWNQEQALESARRQAALRPEIVCPGHGPVVRDATRKFLNVWRGLYEKQQPSHLDSWPGRQQSGL